MIRLFFDLLREAPPQRRAQFWMLAAFITLIGLLELTALGSFAMFVTLLASPQEAMNSRIAHLIHATLRPDATMTQDRLFVFAGFLSLTLILLKNIFVAIQSYWTARFDGALNTDYGSLLLSRVLNQPYETISQYNSADILQTMAWRQYVGTLATHLMTIMSETIVSLMMFASLFLLQPMATGIALAAIGMVGLASYSLLKGRINTLAKRMADLLLSTSRLLMKSVQGFRDVQLYNCAPETMDALNSHLDRFGRVQAAQRVCERGTAWILESVGMGGLICGALVMCLIMDMSSAQVMGLLSMLAVSAWRILPAVYRSVAGISAIRGYQPILERLLAFLHEVSVHPEPEPVELPKLASGVSVRGLGFTYHNSEAPALSGVSFDVKRGQCLGIIGPSGAGKSTLADMLAGLIEPHEGAVIVDGVALDRHTRAGWRQQVGFVPQSPYFFDATLLENVAFTLDPARADPARVADSCTQAGIDEYLGTLSEGLLTPIGERGVRLSGGQAQRIAIARALYRTPQLLIFDEATSALDDKNERVIRDTIRSLRGQKTLIIIAHRLSTVADCDLVIWIEQGRVEACGPPSEVLPLYKARSATTQTECERHSG